MRYLVVSWVVLCRIQYTAVQAQTAIWKFPTQDTSVANLQANVNDTVLLDWTSPFTTAVLRMWCDAIPEYLASSFYVDSNGPFGYILQNYDFSEKSFPFVCHAELAANTTDGGTDTQVKITWHSNPVEVPKTIWQTQAASSVSSTPTSSSTTPTTTTDSQSTTPAQSTKQSTASSGSPSSPTTAPQPSASTPTSPNNTGPIVGEVIGGAALVSFIILALLFLRKYQRDHTSPSLTATEPSKRGFYLFNFYRKGGPKADTTGIFEKGDDHRAYEKDATGLSERTQVAELLGSAAWNKTPSRGKSLAGGRGDNAILYPPVELPGHPNFA